jgi:hypothetical protein
VVTPPTSPRTITADASVVARRAQSLPPTEPIRYASGVARKSTLELAELRSRSAVLDDVRADRV